MSVAQSEIQNRGFRAATRPLWRNSFAGKPDLVKPSENSVRRATTPIIFINDFNNGLSPVECEQVIRSTFEKERVLYEPPHMVNDIEPFNITDGAFHIYQLTHNQRREGNSGIFVGVVDPGVGSDRRGIVVTTKEGFTFIGPDNGIFSPTLTTLTVDSAYKIDGKAFASSSVTFHGRDQFSPVAADIATGKDPSALPQLEEINPETLIKRNFVPGQVVQRDGYGNLKLWQHGIPTENGQRAKALLLQTSPISFGEKVLWARTIRIPVVKTFEDVPDGEWLVYEGSSCRQEDTGLLDLAIRNRSGNASAGGKLKARAGDVLHLTWQF